MPELKRESVRRLLETSERFHAELLRSPFWELIKTEPVILDWINSLSEVDIQLKEIEEPDETKH